MNKSVKGSVTSKIGGLPNLQQEARAKKKREEAREGAGR
jgi:hypothetical protein